jgi:hypothetical protein
MSVLNLLVAGVLIVFVVTRTARWMHRRGWIGWNVRGSSTALGNAMMGVQVIYQPQIREVLEQRLEEPDETRESGDPPDPDGRT